MTENLKPGVNGLPAADTHDTAELERPEQLEREPLIHLEQAGGRTTLTIDLDGIAAEANSAMVKSFENLRHNGEYDSQAALLEFISTCHARMQVLGLSDAELARQMDVTRSYISRIFNVPPNLTMVSMAKLARALGGKIHITVDFNEPPA